MAKDVELVVRKHLAQFQEIEPNRYKSNFRSDLEWMDDANRPKGKKLMFQETRSESRALEVHNNTHVFIFLSSDGTINCNSLIKILHL